MKKYIQEHKYVLLVLYVPVYLIWFALVERMVPSTEGCWVSYLPLDDKIPFLPGFILAYVLWYPFLIFPVIVMLLKDDRRAFIRYGAFIISGFSISLTICMIWPNCQLLRPEVVDTSNLCGWLVNAIYTADTPTNVLPSMHVVGCMGVLAAVFDSQYLKKARIPALIVAVAICAATVFVKQHSILDVFAALALSLVLYLVIYVAARRDIDDQIQHQRQRKRCKHIQNGVLLDKHRCRADGDSDDKRRDACLLEILAVKHCSQHAHTADDVHTRQDIRRGVCRVDRIDQPAAEIARIHDLGAQELAVRPDHADGQRDGKARNDERAVADECAAVILEQHHDDREDQKRIPEHICQNEARQKRDLIIQRQIRHPAPLRRGDHPLDQRKPDQIDRHIQHQQYIFMFLNILLHKTVSLYAERASFDQARASISVMRLKSRINSRVSCSPSCWSTHCTCAHSDARACSAVRRPRSVMCTTTRRRSQQSVQRRSIPFSSSARSIAAVRGALTPRTSRSAPGVLQPFCALR